MNLQNLTQEQAAALALNFVHSLGNKVMDDRSVFQAGMYAFMGTTAVSKPGPGPEEFETAFRRLERLAPRTPTPSK